MLASIVVAGGATRPLLDGIPSSRRHLVATGCDGAELMRTDVDPQAGQSTVVVN
jgi:hypothetical protein